MNSDCKEDPLARRAFPTRVIRGARRSNIWLDVNLGLDTQPASTCSLLGILGASALALRPFTIVRTRLEIRYSSDQSGVSENPFGGFGMIVINDKAAALGITAIPCPITNSNDDWFVWQGMADQFAFGDATGFAQVGQRYDIDSKAMRKVDSGDDVGIVFEQAAAVGALTSMSGRMLVKLH